jgi:hypothetical protein
MFVDPADWPCGGWKGGKGGEGRGRGGGGERERE